MWGKVISSSCTVCTAHAAGPTVSVYAYYTDMSKIWAWSAISYKIDKPRLCVGAMSRETRSVSNCGSQAKLGCILVPFKSSRLPGVIFTGDQNDPNPPIKYTSRLEWNRDPWGCIEPSNRPHHLDIELSIKPSYPLNIESISWYLIQSHTNLDSHLQMASSIPSILVDRVNCGPWSLRLSGAQKWEQRTPMGV